MGKRKQQSAAEIVNHNTNGSLPEQKTNRLQENMNASKKCCRSMLLCAVRCFPSNPTSLTRIRQISMNFLQLRNHACENPSNV